MRAGTPQAASVAASSAVPTGPSVSGAATPPRGTKKPVINPTLLAPASVSAAAASPPALASISAAVLRPTSRQTSASIAAIRRATSFLPGDIHSRPVARRIVDQAVDPRVHRVVVTLLPAEGCRGGPAARDQLQRLDETSGPVLRQEGGLLADQLVILRRLGELDATEQRVGALGLALALHHHQVELEGGIVRHLQARLVADDDAHAIGLALAFQPGGEIDVVAQARIGEALRRTEVADRSL